MTAPPWVAVTGSICTTSGAERIDAALVSGPLPTVCFSWQHSYVKGAMTGRIQSLSAARKNNLLFMTIRGTSLSRDDSRSDPVTSAALVSRLLSAGSNVMGTS